MNRQEAPLPMPQGQPMSRRSLLKGVRAGGLAAGAGGLAAACSSRSTPVTLTAARATINIGFVTPLTGELAGFAAGDMYVVSQIRKSPAYKSGVRIGGRTYKLNVLVADGKSSPATAAQAARRLITHGNADMIVTTSAPETTNPVAITCQKLRTPCLSTVVPWEAWYGSLGGDPLKPIKSIQYCTMFFFGLKEFQGCYAPMWDRIDTNRKVACQFPSDPDGDAFRAGLEPLIQASGYQVIDGGPYKDGATDFTAMISKFKEVDAELFINCPLPPDFITFWQQASHQGWKPKLATVAKVLLFPADLRPLGPLVNNIATDSWWGPYTPNISSLTGGSAKALADGYEATSGNQWVQSLGSTYSLFEVAREALRGVSDPHDAAEVASALHNVNYTGMCGALNFAAGPAPGVAILSPVGVQWRKTTSGTYPYEMKVVDNTLNAGVPIQVDLEPTNA
jgi:branched-chain amino acid transport system substrate-binding protein